MERYHYNESDSGLDPYEAQKEKYLNGAKKRVESADSVSPAELTDITEKNKLIGAEGRGQTINTGAFKVAINEASVKAENLPRVLTEAERINPITTQEYFSEVEKSRQEAIKRKTEEYKAIVPHYLHNLGLLLNSSSFFTNQNPKIEQITKWLEVSEDKYREVVEALAKLGTDVRELAPDLEKQIDKLHKKLGWGERKKSLEHAKHQAMLEEARLKLVERQGKVSPETKRQAGKTKWFLFGAALFAINTAKPAFEQYTESSLDTAIASSGEVWTDSGESTVSLASASQVGGVITSRGGQNPNGASSGQATPIRDFVPHAGSRALPPSASEEGRARVGFTSPLSEPENTDVSESFDGVNYPGNNFEARAFVRDSGTQIPDGELVGEENSLQFESEVPEYNFSLPSVPAWPDQTEVSVSVSTEVPPYVGRENNPVTYNVGSQAPEGTTIRAELQPASMSVAEAVPGNGVGMGVGGAWSGQESYRVATGLPELPQLVRAMPRGALSSAMQSMYYAGDFDSIIPTGSLLQSSPAEFIRRYWEIDRMLNENPKLADAVGIVSHDTNRISVGTEINYGGIVGLMTWSDENIRTLGNLPETVTYGPEDISTNTTKAVTPVEAASISTMGRGLVETPAPDSETPVLPQSETVTQEPIIGEATTEDVESSESPEVLRQEFMDDVRQWIMDDTNFPDDPREGMERYATYFNEALVRIQGSVVESPSWLSRLVGEVGTGNAYETFSEREFTLGDVLHLGELRGDERLEQLRALGISDTQLQRWLETIQYFTNFEFTPDLPFEIVARVIISEEIAKSLQP